MGDAASTPATARRLARERARVLVAARTRRGAAQRTAREPSAQRLTAAACGCDVTDQQAVDAAVAHAATTFGSLDVLVNCAAHCSPVLPLFESQPDESWARDHPRLSLLSGHPAAPAPQSKTSPSV